MLSLSGKESHTTGMYLLCKGRMCVSDRAKVSKIVQEFAKISGRKGDKDSRKAVMDRRFPTRYTPTTPRPQIEEAFTPDELQQALSQLKAGKAADPDSIATDLLKHLLTKGSSVLLYIPISSWLSSGEIDIRIIVDW